MVVANANTFQQSRLMSITRYLNCQANVFPGVDPDDCALILGSIGDLALDADQSHRALAFPEGLLSLAHCI